MDQIGDILGVADQIMMWIFVVEVTARMIVFKGRFWRDPWSIFDFLVVAITLIPATGNLSVLRALRILRALRLISAVPSVRRASSSISNGATGGSPVQRSPASTHELAISRQPVSAFQRLPSPSGCRPQSRWRSYSGSACSPPNPSR